MVEIAEADTDDGRAEQGEERDDRCCDHKGFTHDAFGDGTPEALGALLTTVDSALAPTQRIDSRPEEHEGGGQGCQRDECSCTDRCHSAETEGANHGLRKYQHADETADKKKCGEGDGSPCRGHRPPNRLGGPGTAPEFLAETRQDEQAVVDGHAETDERRDVGGEDTDFGEIRQDAHHRQRRQDGHSADTQRNCCRRHAPEDDQQQHHQDREGDHFGTDQVGASLGVVGIDDGREPAELDVDPIEEPVVADVEVGLHAGVLVSGEGEDSDDRSAVERHEPLCELRRHAPIGHGVADEQ